MLEALKIIGAILGILAFAWKVWDAFSTYLHIKLEIDFDNQGNLKGRTTVENNGVFSKRIDNALLLIGPEHESPIDTFNALDLGLTVHSTNEIAAVHSDQTVIGGDGRMLVPLPFYYSENIAVGDEILTHTAFIPIEPLTPSSNYSARLFVWTTGRYHRSTHDGFTAPIAQNKRMESNAQTVPSFND